MVDISWGLAGFRHLSRAQSCTQDYLFCSKFRMKFSSHHVEVLVSPVIDKYSNVPLKCPMPFKFVPLLLHYMGTMSHMTISPSKSLHMYMHITYILLLTSI